MALPDRSAGQGQPDAFAGLVGGLFDARDLGRMSSELSGFQGPYAARIAGWQTDRLGRLIGAPLRGNVSGRLDSGVNFRSMMYALPYNDITTVDIPEVLLVFPHLYGANTELIRPKTVTHQGDEYLTRRMNEAALHDFRILFTPHTDPAFLDGWNPDPSVSPYNAFVKDSGYFPVTRVSVNDVGTDRMVANAEENAQRLRRRQHVSEIRTDAAHLESLFDPDTIVTLGEISRGLDRWEKGQGV